MLASTERFQLFTSHEMSGHYEGMSALSDGTLYAPMGHFNEEQSASLAAFYIGIGILMPE